MRKGFLSVIITIVMIFGVLPGAINVAMAGSSSVVSVASWSELKTAGASALTDGTVTTIEITENITTDGGTLYISSKNIVIQSASDGPFTITLEGDAMNSEPFIGLSDSTAVLTLKNITFDGNGDKTGATMKIGGFYLWAGTLVMDSGAVIQNIVAENDNTAAGITSWGKVIMKTGSVVYNCKNIERIGGIFNLGGGLTMEGGSITSCKGFRAGGVSSSAPMKVSGLVTISGNTSTTGEDSNVSFSQKISIDATGLDNGSRIGVSSSVNPGVGNPVDVTNQSNGDYSGVFVSDNIAYTVQNSGTDTNQIVQLAVPDITAPVLSAGTVARTSDTAGTVNFTSNEAGAYYYALVAGGGAEPTIDTSVPGIACTTAETTITNPVGLTAGARDIYIKVKDSSNNVSNAIKIVVAAYTAPDITAPVLTADGVSRINDTQGTVKFTSDEVGSYYYAVVEEGGAVPIIDTSVPGIACTTAETTITNPVGLTAGAKDIYIKVKDSSNNVSDAIKIEISVYIAPDIIAPMLTAGPVIRINDTSGTVKFTSNEAGSYYCAVVENGGAVPIIDTSVAGTTCTIAETTITNPVGLTAGAKTIYIKVKDARGNVSDVLKLNIVNFVPPSSGSSSSSNSSSSNNSSSSDGPSSGKEKESPKEAVIIIVNGEEQRAGRENKSTEEGKSTVTVQMDNDMIENKIREASKENDAGSDNVIQVPIMDTKSKVGKVELTGKMVKDLEGKKFDVSIKRDHVEYIIPAEEFTISKVAEKLGVPEVDLVDIKVEVIITNLDEKVIENYKENAQMNGAELVVAPVSFEVVAKTKKADGSIGVVEIDKFSNYVERVMEIPEDVDPKRITTGIVLNPDGTYSHVPTVVYLEGGKWYAKLNSLTNSNYSVIWNPVEVASVENHWGKDAVNEMASRLIITDTENFQADQAISRVEFLAHIVRALGVYREGFDLDNNLEKRDDDQEKDHIIQIAKSYGIIDESSNQIFDPDGLMTREEAIVICHRVMKITKLTGRDTMRYENYTDFEEVSNEAQNAVREVLSAHVFNGTSTTTISPKDMFTYAEAAQAITNILVESELINQ